MSTISALKVFSLFGRKSVESLASSSESPHQAMPGGGKSAGDSDQQPWEMIFQRLDQMDDNNKKGFETFTKTVSKLTEDFASMQTSQAALKQEVGVVQGETAELKEGMVTVHRRLDDTNLKIDELSEATANRFRELEAALLVKVKSLPIQFPALSVGQQMSVNERFESLRNQAKACRNIFVLGNVPDFGPVAPLKSVILNFFPKCDMKSLPKAGKTKVWRVSVQMEKVDEVKKISEVNVFSIRDHGWWIQQDLPLKLRQMHSNAYTFIKLLKDRFLRLRLFVYEAEDGYLVVEKTPIVPVYLIPKKRDKWEELATVLASEIGGLVETEWLKSVLTNNIDPKSILEKWCAVLGVEVASGDGDLIEDSEDTDALLAPQNNVGGG